MKKKVTHALIGESDVDDYRFSSKDIVNSITQVLSFVFSGFRHNGGLWGFSHWGLGIDGARLSLFAFDSCSLFIMASEYQAATSS